MRVLQGDEPQDRSDNFAWRSRTYSSRAGARRPPAARRPTIQGRLVDPGLSREPLVCSRADPTIGAREEYRAAAKPFAISLDTRRNSVARFRALDHYHTHLDFLQSVADPEHVGPPSTGPSVPPLRRRLSSRSARPVASVQTVLCSTLLKLVLMGSVVSIATFCASSQSSLFCAETTSKASRLRAVERCTISSSDLVSARRDKNSRVALVLSLEISMTLAP